MKIHCLLLLACAYCASALAQTDHVAQPRNALIYSPTTKYSSLLDKPEPNAKAVASAHRADSVELLEYLGGPYCMVRIPPGQLATDGYLPVELFKYDSVMVAFVNATNKKVGKNTRLAYEVPPPFIKDRASTKTYYPPASNSRSVKSTSNSQSYSSGSASSTHTIQTGPRGAKYYINKNGNKTYVKKK